MAHVDTTRPEPVLDTGAIGVGEAVVIGILVLLVLLIVGVL